jgi:hypothetical protein
MWTVIGALMLLPVLYRVYLIFANYLEYKRLRNQGVIFTDQITYRPFKDAVQY